MPERSDRDPKLASSLRVTIDRLRETKDRTAMAMQLRRLRRITDLTANEHRQVFRHLRAHKGDLLIERYLKTLQKVSPTTDTWTKVALALWSEGRSDELFAWSVRHPAGPDAAGRELLALANLSAKHKEIGSARAVLRQAARLSLSDAALISGVKQLAEQLAPQSGDELLIRQSGKRKGKAARRDFNSGPAEGSPGKPALRNHVDTMRALYKDDRFADAFTHGINVIRTQWPFAGLEAADQKRLVTLARNVERAGIASRQHLAPPIDWLQDLSPPNDVLTHFVAAMIRSSVHDREGALASLAAAQAITGHRPARGGLDIAAEKALIHVRYRHFGEALRNIGTHVAVSGEYYTRQLRHLRNVAAFCEPEFYPECLQDVIMREVAASPIGYEPERGHLATITGSLAQGGGERQTVNIVEGLVRDGRVARQSVLIRSVESENGFFLPELEKLPVSRIVYGRDWKQLSDVVECLPMLGERQRLATAIDLLPHTIREEVIRVTALLLEVRPEVVHVRQDLFPAALACAIAGVPKYFVHRGSLSRDAWDNSPLQGETLVRPMRHAYRALLEQTGFFIVNNSEQGRQSDIAWLDWPDTSRFHLVPNAVEFERLGPSSGQNNLLRGELGIPEDAPVVGGMFRMVSVKRPMLWIEIARKVLGRLPNAHFIIAGDEGDFGPEVRAYAEVHGFSDRLHTPGAVVGVGDWYRAMNLLLLTSDREGLPNVNIEAQHFGIPVVSSDVGGAPETIEPGITGHLVPPHAGAEAFVERVVGALTDMAWRQRAAERGPHFVHQGFGTTQALDKLIRLYGFD